MKSLRHLFGGSRQDNRPFEAGVHAIIRLIHHYGDAIMAKLSEATAQLDALTAQVEKIRTEVEALKAAAADMTTTPEFDASLARLGTALQGVDELNEDAAPPATDEGG